jgi:hypothetical protein
MKGILDGELVPCEAEMEPNGCKEGKLGKLTENIELFRTGVDINASFY